MKSMITISILIIALGITFYSLLYQSGAEGISKSEIGVAAAMSGAHEKIYKKVIVPIEFEFPRDHFAHNEYRTEWWYFTGNLESSTGETFGYQFTIFRTAMRPDSVVRESIWRSHQIYMAHFALTDIYDEKFYASDKITRNGNGLGGADSSLSKIWCQDWQIDIESDENGEVWIVSAKDDEKGIYLKCRPIKPKVFHGENGLSKKSNDVGNASYYYSYTRMETDGKVIVGNDQYDVFGSSWMDREWSTSALSKNQVGWDWFSIQFEDTTELMFFRLRKADGSSDFEKGTYILQNSEVERIYDGDVIIDILKSWESPLGGTYPSGWKIMIPDKNIDIEVKPQIKEQELNVALRYWEGSVSVNGKKNGIKISGKGYVELTGYAESNI